MLPCFLDENSVSVSYLGEALYYYDATINEESLVRRITKESMESGFAMVSYLEGLWIVILKGQYPKSRLI